VAIKQAVFAVAPFVLGAVPATSRPAIICRFALVAAIQLASAGAISHSPTYTCDDRRTNADILRPRTCREVTGLQRKRFSAIPFFLQAESPVRRTPYTEVRPHERSGHSRI